MTSIRKHFLAGGMLFDAGSDSDSVSCLNLFFPRIVFLVFLVVVVVVVVVRKLLNGETFDEEYDEDDINLLERRFKNTCKTD